MFIYMSRNTNTHTGHASNVSNIDNNNDTKNQNRSTNPVCDERIVELSFIRNVLHKGVAWISFNRRDTEFSVRIGTYTLSLPHSLTRSHVRTDIQTHTPTLSHTDS